MTPIKYTNEYAPLYVDEFLLQQANSPSISVMSIRRAFLSTTYLWYGFLRPVYSHEFRKGRWVILVEALFLSILFVLNPLFCLLSRFDYIEK